MPNSYKYHVSYIYYQGESYGFADITVTLTVPLATDATLSILRQSLQEKTQATMIVILAWNLMG